MTNFINPAVFEREFFLVNTPLWAWQVNGYALIMVVWNTVLAAIPIALAVVLARSLRDRRPWWQIGLLGIAWILFVPNAAYVMADIRHIIGYCPIGVYGNVCSENAWMTLFFFAYGLIGWVALILSIRPVRLAIKERFNCHVADIATIIVIPIIGLGFLLGLVNRWNSWDILHHPISILAGALRYGTDLTYLVNWIMVSVLLYALYAVGDWLCRRIAWEGR